MHFALGEDQDSSIGADMTGDPSIESELETKAVELFERGEFLGNGLVVTGHSTLVSEFCSYSGHNRHSVGILRGTVVRYVESTAEIDVTWDAAD